jgi:hypothetical protein
MGVYESPEKMVVSTANLCSVIHWNITRIGRKFGNCAIYLYLILKLHEQGKAFGDHFGIGFSAGCIFLANS